MRDEDYNGWSNFETWLVNLWMDNEQGSQQYYRDTAKEYLSAAKKDAVWTKAQHASFQFADWLKEHHEENRPELPGVYGDLLGGALWAVNWNEIARHYIDAVLEEVSHAG